MTRIDSREPALAPLVLLACIGTALPLGAFAGGYYDSSVWAPGGLGLIAIVVALLVGGVPRPSSGAATAVIGLVGLAVWAGLSATWTDSIQQALVEANRFVVYAALLFVLVALVRDDRTAGWMLAATGTGVTIVAVVVTVRLLSGDETILFSGRLNEPLGYVNGQAHLFVLGLWPCLALAEQRRSAALAGLGAGVATLLAALVVLAQSRGAVLAILVSSAVVLAVIPHRTRRLAVLLVISVSVAAVVPALFDVYDLDQARRPTGDALRDGALLALLAAATAGVAWGALTASLAALSESRPGSVDRVRRIFRWAVVATTVAAAVWGIASAGRIADYVDRQYTGFVKLRDPTGETRGARLVAGAGNRYDYWRVAVDAWGDAPLLGIGAGGFDEPYFAHRSTVEDVRQPHSLPLQALSELGLVGVAFLVIFLLSVASGARRQAAWARAGKTSVPIVTSALGMFTAWLVHTSVDWMHLLPALTGVALCGAAILLRGTDAPFTIRLGRGGRMGFVAAVCAALVAGALSLSRQTLAEHHRDAAQGALEEDPGRALERADRALRFDREDVQAYYVKAAALARFGQADASRDVLLEAARREPRDFVTWALLGDLAVRRGELGEAGSHYSRATRLNPRDPTLRTLARDPASALVEPAVP